MNATPTSRQSRNFRPFPGDEKLYVAFSTEAMESPIKTKETGRPVFDDVEMIEIRIPGDDKTIIKNQVSDEYRERFPDEYAAFKSSTTLATTGTPLEHWAALTKSQVASLKFSHIQTVEDVASISDANLTQLGMGGNELRTKAKAFVAAATDTAFVEKQAAELNEVKAQMKAMQEEFARQLAAATAPAPADKVKAK
jgi:hypothetical protein